MKPKCLTNSSTPVFVISSNNIQYINGTWLTRFHCWFFPNSCNQFSPITRPKMLALVQQHFPKSATHRVHIDWLSGIHSIMKENQPRLVKAKGGGGVVHAHPLSLYSPSRTKLQCTLQLRGQIHSPYFISIPMHSVQQPSEYGLKGKQV